MEKDRVRSWSRTDLTLCIELNSKPSGNDCLLTSHVRAGQTFISSTYPQDSSFSLGKALANLKLPGVGALSQSTICRFESLTLSHNNMVALKPVLQAWLEAAELEAAKRERGHLDDGKTRNWVWHVVSPDKNQGKE